MAVPKRKISKQRTHTRAANWRITGGAIGQCSTCHEFKQPHRVCKHCGSYDGEKKLEIKSKKD